MGLVGFAVKAESVDRPLTLLHVGFFLWNLLCIQCDELVDTSDVKVVTELLVYLATVSLVYSDILNSLFVEARLLLECNEQI